MSDSPGPRRSQAFWLPTQVVMVGALVSAAGAGCAVLDPLEPMVCGNGAVDYATEDCDGRSSHPGARCAERGEPHPCVYVCTGGYVCPPDFRCGWDGVCKAPTGAFAEQPPVSVSDTARLAVGDFDGDGADDVLAFAPQRSEVLYFDEDARLEASARFPATWFLPAVEHLTEDGRSDVAVVDDDSLMVFEGRDDRSLAPISYAPWDFYGPAARVAVVPALPRTAADGGGGPGGAGAGGDGAGGDGGAAWGGYGGAGAGDAGGAGGAGGIRGAWSGDGVPEGIPPTGLPHDEELVVLLGNEEPHDLPFDRIVMKKFVPRDDRTGSGQVAPEPIAGVDRRRLQDLSGPVVHAQLDETLPCDQFILPFRGDRFVTIVSTCARLPGPSDPPKFESNWDFGQDQPGPEWPAVEIGTADSAPLEQPVVVVVDLDRDGHLDLLIGESEPFQPSNEAPTPPPPKLYVAFGVGRVMVGEVEGQPVEYMFESRIPGDANNGWNRAGVVNLAQDEPRLGKLPSGTPLVAGDIDGDGGPDFVTSTGIWLLQNPDVPPPEQVWTNVVEQLGIRFSSATIEDVHGDHHVDVVAADADRAQLWLFAGAGSGMLNPFAIPLGGVPRILTTGDFDGDLLTDIAVVEASGATPTTAEGSTDTLTVCFGKPTGGPDAPTTLGLIGPNADFVGGNYPRFEADAVDDLLVISEAEHEEEAGTEWTAALFAGSGARQLVSPFRLNVDAWRGDQPIIVNTLTPLMVVAGEFNAPRNDAETAAAGSSVNDLLHPDISVLTRYEYLDPGTAEPLGGLALWLLPSSGRATLSRETATLRTLKGDSADDEAAMSSVDQSIWVNVDLDGDDRDEIVALIPTSASAWDDDGTPVTEASRLFVFQSDGFDPDDPNLLVALGDVETAGTSRAAWFVRSGEDNQGISVGHRFGASPQTEWCTPPTGVDMDAGASSRGGEVFGKLVAARLDDDELPDLLAIGTMGAGTNGGCRDEILVIVNPGIGPGSTDLLSASSVAPVPRFDGIRPQTFALANVRGDAALELVVLGEDDDADGTEPRGRAYAATLSVVAPTTPGGAPTVELVDPVYLDGVGGGRDVMVGDFDADGIDDLAVARGPSMFLYRGMWRLDQ